MKKCGTAQILFLWFFCVSFFQLTADTASRYLIDSWSPAEGFPSSLVKAVTQTGDGYLWAATDKGLVCFDGVRFQLVSFLEKDKTRCVQQNDNVDIPQSLYLDHRGNLWIGSAGAVTSRDKYTRRFLSITTADGLENDKTRLIFEDLNGNLWVGFYSSYLNRIKNRRITVFNRSNGLMGKKISVAVEDQKGGLLFGSREAGIFVLKGETFVPFPVSGLENRLLITMYMDKSGRLWIGTDSGLLRVDDAEVKLFTTENGLPENYITSILEEGTDGFLFGTPTGLHRMKNIDGVCTFQTLLTGKTVLCLFKDREGSLWIGTYGSGLLRLKERRFTTIPPAENFKGEILSAIYEDDDDSTWIGTINGKLFQLDKNRNSMQHQLPELMRAAIGAVTRDKTGRLWVGANGKGVLQRNTNDIWTRFTTSHGLSDNLVTSIYEDSQGRLWFGTFDGLSLYGYEAGKFSAYYVAEGLPGKKVNNVTEDCYGDIWVAADRGVVRFKAGRMMKEAATIFLAGTTATFIYEDPDGGKDRILWITTHGQGLKRLDQKTGIVTTFTTAQGMSGNYLYRIFEDAAGDFWMMSDVGVLKVNKIQMCEVVQGGEDIVHCASFGISDGLESLGSNNPFSRHSALKKKDGRLWFLTKSCITEVNPAKFRINKIPPPVVIETVMFNGNDVPIEHNGKYRPLKGGGDLEIQFTAPTFLSPQKITFKYQLEGNDQKWRYADKRRRAKYRNLEPGNYRFNVIACNADGVWNREGAMFNFTVKPLFHQTRVFKFLLLLLIVSAAFSALRLYRYLKKRTYLKMEQKTQKDQRTNRETNRQTNRVKEKYKKSNLHPDYVRECIIKLHYQMEIEKVFKDDKLTLHTLAGKIEIPYYHLSQILNDTVKQNFSEYVNTYRIEEAKKILNDPASTGNSVKYVLYQVGFNTQSVFYSAFKKNTGLTPTAYKKIRDKLRTLP